MATLKYLLQSKGDNAPVYLRLSLGRSNSIKRKTGLYINPDQWSPKTGLPKQTLPENKNLSYQLKKLEAFIFEQLNIDGTTGKEINGNWLVNNINRHFNHAQPGELDYIVEYGKEFLGNLHYKTTDNGKKGVTDGTIKKYATIVNKLSAYESYAGRKLKLTDIDLRFRTEFIKYLTNQEKLSDNTTGRYLKFVKSIVLDAQKNGYNINEKIKHFKGFTVDSPKVILSYDELDLLKNTELSNDIHNITRDWLLIGCYTGQRVSDLLRMNTSMIQEIEGFKFIVLEQIKTGKTVQIPIHYEVLEILNKRNGEFPPLFTQNIDSNKALFNRYLKQLCKLVGINELVEGNYFDPDKKRSVSGLFEKYKLVSSHICRRSFASLFYGNPLYPTPILMNITAHSTERQFLEYIGKKPIDYSLQLAKLWENESLKNKKEPQLEVVKEGTNN